ncbi:hypothetical protein GCM10009796_10290 [Microbacterium koreense]
MRSIAMTIAVLTLAATALAGCTGSTEAAPSTSADTAPSPSASAPTPSATPTLDPEPDVPCDNGPNDSATGTVETNESGVPIAYIVEAGDTMWGINNRFCLDDVAERNGINPGQIYPGDRLTLEARG